MLRASAAANTSSILVLAVVSYWLPARVFGTTNASEDFCKGKPRSATLRAANARNRAFAETSARVPARSEGTIVDAPCTNTSRLFVSSSEGQFDLAFMQSPTPSRPGNGLEMIDWSPSGQYLLSDLFTYQYEGEGAEHTPLIYDANSGLIYQPDLLRLFRDHFKNNCGAASSIKGFTADGRIVVRAEPLARNTTYEPITPPSCVKKVGFWALDFRNGDLQPLGDHYQIKKYATPGEDK